MTPNMRAVLEALRKQPAQRMMLPVGNLKFAGMSTRNRARRRKGSHRMASREFNPTARQIEAARHAQADHAQNRQWREAERASGKARYLINRFTARYADPTFVYFIRQTGLPGGGRWVPEGPVKIGVARNPISRIRELQCGNPSDLYIEYAIVGDHRLEHQLHRHYEEDAGIQGEWFGRGYEDAIVLLAAETMRRQIRALKAGSSFEYVRDVLPRDVFLRDQAGRHDLDAPTRIAL